MIKKRLLSYVFFMVLTGCSLDVDSPKSYALFSLTGDDAGGLVNDVTNFLSCKYQLRVKGPDGEWRSEWKDPTSSERPSQIVNVVFEAPRLWVGRKHTFLVCARDPDQPLQGPILVGRKKLEIKKNTNVVRVDYDDELDPAPCLD